jgi:pyrroloquinoline quinone biosynthesis protein D
MPSIKPMAVTEMASREPDASEMPGMGDPARPRLAAGVRMRFDAVRGRHVLLLPEAILILNATGAEIVELCDGRRTLADIRAELRSRYGEVAADEAHGYLDDLVSRHAIEVDDD